MGDQAPSDGVIEWDDLATTSALGCGLGGLGDEGDEVLGVVEDERVALEEFGADEALGASVGQLLGAKGFVVAVGADGYVGEDEASELDLPYFDDGLLEDFAFHAIALPGFGGGGCLQLIECGGVEDQGGRGADI